MQQVVQAHYMGIVPDSAGRFELEEGLGGPAV